MQKRQWLRHSATSPCVSNHRLRRSRGSQACSLTGTTRLSLLVNVSIPFYHVVDWQSRFVFQPLPLLDNNVLRERRSRGMRKTWPNHLTLFGSSVSSNDWTLVCSTLRITSIIQKLPHHTVPILQEQECSNTKRLWISSALNDHVLNRPHWCCVHLTFDP